MEPVYTTKSDIIIPVPDLNTANSQFPPIIWHDSALSAQWHAHWLKLRAQYLRTSASALQK